MANFAYKNAKNASMGYITFKFNYDYHPRVFLKEILTSNQDLALLTSLLKR